MIVKCVFSVLLLLIPRTESGLMRDSTCETIKNQLYLIDYTINDAFRTIASTSPYTWYTVDKRLERLFSSYRNYLVSNQWYENQVSTFVEEKLKQFNIPVNGLEENISLLEKIFSMVDDRNSFQQSQVNEQIQMNQTLTTELLNNQLQLKALEEKQQQLQLELVEFNNTLIAEEKKNKMLQAKINGNPATVQG
uniref:Secreted protein n=1 Tax=Anopheles funestus TaxID=62324 RepID=A0A4Y0BDU3_ANOFN